MSAPDQAPNACPFCGAAAFLNAGKPIRSDNGKRALYACGMAVDVEMADNRVSQTKSCATAERSRLTNELNICRQRSAEKDLRIEDLKTRVYFLEKDLSMRLNELEGVEKERDEARKLDVQATQHCVDVMNERDAALARVRRLEEALELGVGKKRANELINGNHFGGFTDMVPHTKEVVCPDCYGGHFKPCNICGDSGVALIQVEAKEAKP